MMYPPLILLEPALAPKAQGSDSLGSTFRADQKSSFSTRLFSEALFCCPVAGGPVAGGPVWPARDFLAACPSRRHPGQGIITPDHPPTIPPVQES